MRRVGMVLVVALLSGCMGSSQGDEGWAPDVGVQALERVEVLVFEAEGSVSDQAGVPVPLVGVPGYPLVGVDVGLIPAPPVRAVGLQVDFWWDSLTQPLPLQSIRFQLDDEEGDEWVTVAFVDTHVGHARLYLSDLEWQGPLYATIMAGRDGVLLWDVAYRIEAVAFVDRMVGEGR